MGEIPAAGIAAEKDNAHTALIRQVAARLDGIPSVGLHLFVASICFFGSVIDSLEIGMTGVLGTVFSAPGSTVSHRELEILLSSGIFGMTIGTQIFGYLSDRFGRRSLMVPLLVIASIGSICAGFSSTVSTLSLWRFFCGLASGGYMVVEVVYLVEMLPARTRGTWVMAITCIGAALGGTGGKMLTRAFTDAPLLGLEGWRITLIAGGIFGILQCGALLLLPESARWLARKGRRDEAERVCAQFEKSKPLPWAANGTQREAVPASPISAPVQTGSYVTRIIQFCALMFFSAWASSAFTILSGIVFARTGYSVRDSLLFSAIVLLGSPTGALLGTALIDRFPRPALLSIAFICSAISGVTFALTAQNFHIIAIAAGFFYATAGVIIFNGLKLLGGEIFPTASRGVTSGAGVASNRIGAILVPLMLLPILHTYGHIATFGVLSFSMLLASGLVLLLPKNTTGRSVE